MNITGVKVATANDDTLAVDTEGTALVLTVRNGRGIATAVVVLHPVAAESFARTMVALAKKASQRRYGR